MTLHNLFYPRGVALIGSVSEGKLGWEVLRKLLDGGYEHVYAINPRAQGALSAPGFKSATEIDQPVDLAVVVAPTATVPAVLEDCGRAGVRAAVIITAGFSEVGNHAGESEVKRMAERYGIRFIGPNCAGLVNTSHHLYPTLETHPPAGGVAIVAQGGNTGFDAGKKVKGRKRHLVVDTLGLLLAVTITAASVQDRDAAAEVVAQACAKVPGLKKLYTDAAYGGKCAQAIEHTHGISVEVVRHPGNRSTGTWQDAQQPLWPEVVAKGFVVQAKRWVVERTHAWNERARRLMAHHDRSNWAPLAWVWLAEARILATRMAA